MATARQISCFKNYNTPGNPVSINLLTWLTNIKYKNKVDLIRSLDEKSKRDEIKAQLPGITPSGIFTYRKRPAPFSGTIGQPVKTEIHPTKFIPFGEYIQGLHFENQRLMTSNSYPASWDSLDGTKYIDDRIKKFILMAEKNPVILQMAKSFEFS